MFTALLATKCVRAQFRSFSRLTGPMRFVVIGQTIETLYFFFFAASALACAE
jgi:hypothetical protein